MTRPFPRIRNNLAATARFLAVMTVVVGLAVIAINSRANRACGWNTPGEPNFRCAR